MMADLYRVDELALEAGVSVDTIRYYQHRGLLQPPAREGRVALYSDEHIARLGRIREFKDQGLPLATIKRILAGSHPEDAALVSAVAGASEPRLTLDEVSQAANVPLGILNSLVEEGLLVPRSPGPERWYTDADVRAVRAGMNLLEAGVPLSELVDLGRRYSGSVAEIAEEAVTLFDRYIRKPEQDRRTPEAGQHLLEAFNELLPAASELVRHNFERAVLAAARKRIEESDEEQL